MDSLQNKFSTQGGAVARLAQASHVAPAEVLRLYENELRKLGVTDYLPILAIHNVKSALRLRITETLVAARAPVFAHVT